MNKSLFNRLEKMEKLKPNEPEINTSLINTLEEAGYNLKSRKGDNSLDISSQSAYDQSVIALLSDEELTEIAEELLKNYK